MLIRRRIRRHNGAPSAGFDLPTALTAPIDMVCKALQRPATPEHVSRGWLDFRPADPPELPSRWPIGGGDFEVALTAFGFVPAGRQIMGVRWPEMPPPYWSLRDDGRGSLAILWDHRIGLFPEGPVATRYTARLRIAAGRLTPPVTLWARGFHTHRQRRWHRLVRRGFAAE